MEWLDRQWVDTVLEALTAFFLVAGSLITFISSFGMVHLRDFYLRMHGPAKATTLGVGLVLFASSLYFILIERTFHIQLILVTIFLLITAPISAHLLAKAALHRKLPSTPDTRGAPGELKPEDTAREPDTPHPEHPGGTAPQRPEQPQ
ncbi:Na+/H+ antiporter subunit G [Kushneria aurantia]|uniref:Na+/H+ antiporter subunit G n=1 Tax=Kushneria aurantia TaxID=504092 RepID=A0ABV6G578_9GAMM|nr:Na+/H+ antiporter subunit G [Kushneria aurantia]